VPWERYQDVVTAQDWTNRAQFTHLLAQAWLPELTDIHVRLRDEGGRIADVACGTGWSTIAMARGYPKASVDGLDLDRGSIETARARLASEAADIADRVTFQARDAGDPGLAGRYDLAVILEAVHDMAQPVHALQAGDNFRFLKKDEPNIFSDYQSRYAWLTWDDQFADGRLHMQTVLTM
jgi:2-polyprenyl-3-methyl-5-hydroxy-6-metoxy-1,4-benzoquinol methylase